MTDDFSSLRVRLNRLEGRAAWSERPHSRMRRHVSGVRITGASEAGLTVVSELLLFWARDVEEYLVSCRREDLLVEENGLKLARRTVYLDHDRLPVPNLSLPL
jgi:3-phenylpropionate/cinnamic acid dioxygenase small subunit